MEPERTRGSARDPGVTRRKRTDPGGSGPPLQRRYIYIYTSFLKMIYLHIYIYTFFLRSALYIYIYIYIYMSAPINARPRTSHFSNPSAAVAPPVSTAFSYTNGAWAFGRRRKHVQSACFRSVCLGNAVETGGATAADGFEKCEVRGRVLIGALIYIMYTYGSARMATNAKPARQQAEHRE